MQPQQFKKVLNATALWLLTTIILPDLSLTLLKQKANSAIRSLTIVFVKVCQPDQKRNLSLHNIFVENEFSAFRLLTSDLNAECSVLVKRYLLNRLGCATFNGSKTGKESRVFSNSKIVLNDVLFFQTDFGRERINGFGVSYRKSTFSDDSIKSSKRTTGS
ncbi:hypothetical protein FQA39_LY06610 [Lamprigera yunnana]|nr:hypothetical protein FQA39_LY06610 [Lamprigera yunnana]